MVAIWMRPSSPARRVLLATNWPFGNTWTLMARRCAPFMSSANFSAPCSRKVSAGITWACDGHFGEVGCTGDALAGARIIRRTRWSGPDRRQNGSRVIGIPLLCRPTLCAKAYHPCYPANTMLWVPKRRSAIPLRSHSSEQGLPAMGQTMPRPPSASGSRWRLPPRDAAAARPSRA